MAFSATHAHVHARTRMHTHAHTHTHMHACAGLGMNQDELARNSQLTEFAVKDLNLDPKLPFEDASFDVVTNAGTLWNVGCGLLCF